MQRRRRLRRSRPPDMLCKRLSSATIGAPGNSRARREEAPQENALESMVGLQVRKAHPTCLRASRDLSNSGVPMKGSAYAGILVPSRVTCARGCLDSIEAERIHARHSRFQCAVEHLVVTSHVAVVLSSLAPTDVDVTLAIDHMKVAE